MAKYTVGDYLGQDSTEYLVYQLLSRWQQSVEQIRAEIPKVNYQPRLVSVDVNTYHGNESRIAYNQIGSRDSQNRSYAKVEISFSGDSTAYLNLHILNTSRVCKPAIDTFAVGEYLQSRDGLKLRLKPNGDIQFDEDATVQSASAAAYLLVRWLD
jgi:hypothetical protein